MTKSVPRPESWLATLPTELSPRLFANARQLEYHCIVANQQIVDDEYAYAIGPRGNINRAVDKLNVEAVVEIINKRVITRFQR